jgi:hypothetical protein
MRTCLTGVSGLNDPKVQSGDRHWRSCAVGRGLEVALVANHFRRAGRVEERRVLRATLVTLLVGLGQGSFRRSAGRVGHLENVVQPAGLAEEAVREVCLCLLVRLAVYLHGGLEG